MADDATIPWYKNIGTWINIIQGLLGILIAVGGIGTEAHAASIPDIGAGFGVAGLGVVHEVRRRAVAKKLPTDPQISKRVM